MGWVCSNLTSVASQGDVTAHKKQIILYLEVLLEFHLQADELREPLCFYYEQNESEHIELIVSLLTLRNNIIQNLLGKLVIIVLNQLNCVDF